MRSPFEAAPAHTRSGFTLVELMVSTAIIGIIMMVLLATTTASLGMWRGAEGRIAVEREGRNAVALMTDDLRSMIKVSDPPPVFPVGTGDFGSSIPDDGSVFMEFFTLRPNDFQARNFESSGDVGDICYVQYRFRDNKIERAFAGSKATFDALRQKSRPTTGNFEVLADNIPGGNLWVYARDADGKPASTTLATVFVSVSFGVVEATEMQNLKRGITLPGRKTTQQYFSSRAFLPAP